MNFLFLNWILILNHRIQFSTVIGWLIAHNISNQKKKSVPRSIEKPLFSFLISSLTRFEEEQLPFYPFRFYSIFYSVFPYQGVPSCSSVKKEPLFWI